MIEKIRRSVKKWRIAMIAIVVVIIVGLIAGFATWSSPSRANNASQDPAQQAKDQIANLESANKYLVDDLAKDPNNYSSLTALGQNCMQVGSYYDTSGDQAKAKTNYEQALDCYTKAIANEPAELNAKGKSNDLVNKANALYLLGRFDEAQKEYLTAIELSPTDLDTNYAYIYVLCLEQNFEEARVIAGNLKVATTDATVSGQVDQIINSIEAQEKQAAEAQNQDSQTTNPDAETDSPDTAE